MATKRYEWKQMAYDYATLSKGGRLINKGEVTASSYAEAKRLSLEQAGGTWNKSWAGNKIYNGDARTSTPYFDLQPATEMIVIQEIQIRDCSVEIPNPNGKVMEDDSFSPEEHQFMTAVTETLIACGWEDDEAFAIAPDVLTDWEYAEISPEPEPEIKKVECPECGETATVHSNKSTFICERCDDYYRYVSCCDEVIPDDESCDCEHAEPQPVRTFLKRAGRLGYVPHVLLSDGQIIREKIYNAKR